MSAKISAPPSIPFATSIIADLTRDIAQINQRVDALEQSVRDTRLEVARRLDALAKDISYPINSIPVMRQHLRDLAEELRAEASEARHG